MELQGVEPCGHCLQGRPRSRTTTPCWYSRLDLRQHIPLCRSGPHLFPVHASIHWRSQRDSNSPRSIDSAAPDLLWDRIGCRPATRTQRVRINSPVPTPGGTVGKSRNGADGGTRTRPLRFGRPWPNLWTTSAQYWRALCIALRLPVSMRRIVACAGLGTGVSGWCERGGPLSLPVCPRPCAGGKADQNSIVVSWARDCPTKECDHDGL